MIVRGYFPICGTMGNMDDRWAWSIFATSISNFVGQISATSLWPKTEIMMSKWNHPQMAASFRSTDPFLRFLGPAKEKISGFISD